MNVISRSGSNTFSGRAYGFFRDSSWDSAPYSGRFVNGEPELLEPGRVYRFDIDMWATANRFRAGHRLRVDIASADFPRFDRNANLGGEPGRPVPARVVLRQGHWVAFSALPSSW